VNTTKQVAKRAASDLIGSEVSLKRKDARGVGRVHSFILVDDVFLFEVLLTAFIGGPSSIPPEWKVGEVIPLLYGIRGVGEKITLRGEVFKGEKVCVYLNSQDSTGEKPKEEMAGIVQFPVRHE